MHRKHLTKITATLGPATADPRMLQALFTAGVDVFRLNFSHGSHDDHRRSIETIRALEAEAGRPIAILRSEEHTSELQSLMRISYAVFCLKKKNKTNKVQTDIKE